MADDSSQKRKPNFRTAVEDVKVLATVIAMEAESILGRRTARVVGVSVLFAVVVGGLLAILDWYVAPSGAAQKQALVVTLAQILGGTALLSGLYFTWRTLQVNREGQITERYTRAIDQLGSEQLQICIGGIYALERIDKESPGRAYHGTVMEVLSAYVRENSTQAPRLPKGSSEAASTPNEATAEAEEGAKQPAPAEPRRPTTDIQAILDVLGRARASIPDEDLTLLDLHGADLRGADLRGADLRRVLLQQADLREARLRRANLRRADLREADLRGADLVRANLEGASLMGANLLEAKVTLEQLASAKSQLGVITSDASKQP